MTSCCATVQTLLPKARCPLSGRSSLNYYTAGLEKHNASSIDPKQLTLPL